MNEPTNRADYFDVEKPSTRRVNCLCGRRLELQTVITTHFVTDKVIEAWGDAEMLERLREYIRKQGSIIDMQHELIKKLIALPGSTTVRYEHDLYMKERELLEIDRRDRVMCR